MVFILRKRFGMFFLLMTWFGAYFWHSNSALFFSESDLVNVVTTPDYQLNYWTEEQFGKKKSESWRIVFILRISIDFFC
jgi:hypothetical protein